MCDALVHETFGMTPSFERGQASSLLTSCECHEKSFIWTRRIGGRSFGAAQNRGGRFICRPSSHPAPSPRFTESMIRAEIEALTTRACLPRNNIERRQLVEL